MRTDPLLSFDWAEDAPAEGVPSDGWLTRWTGLINLPTAVETQQVQFGVAADEGFKLWVGNGASPPLVDKWSEDDKVTAYLPARAYALSGRVEKVSTTRAGQTTGAERTLTYDDDDKITTVSDDGTVSATVSYDPVTQELASVSYGSSGSTLAAVARDAAGRTIGHTWTVGGETITDTVARSQSGRIVQHTTTRGTTIHTSTYGYDAAGRLTKANIPGHQLTYGFGGASGCVNPNAGRSGNRTSLTDVYTAPGETPVTTSTGYCYDYADRLLSSTVNTPVAGAHAVADGLAAADVVYDARGNTTRLADMQFTYDAANRHVGTTYDDGSTVTYLRDVAGRIIRSTTTPAGADPVTVTYLYAGAADVAWGQVSGEVLTRTVGLPGGVNVTSTEGEEATWSFPNLQGHTLLTRTGETSSAALMLWDPFGQPLDPDTLAIGTTTADDTGTLVGNTGWHQGALKQAATVGSASVIEMGARLYLPALGRFLQVDPVEGGVDNDYVWPTEPIGSSDLTGEAACAYCACAPEGCSGGSWNNYCQTHGEFSGPLREASNVIGPTVLGLVVPGVGAFVFASRVALVGRTASSYLAGEAGAAATISASRPVAATAGLVYTSAWQRTAVWQRAQNGTRWIQNGARGYRSSANKGRFGRSSSITYSTKGRHDYRVFHINHATTRRAI